MSGTNTGPFDEKDPADYDGFTVETKYWLGPEDGFASTPTVASVTPAGLTVASTVLNGTLLTLWASGGVSGTTYAVRLNLVTLAGRNVFRSVDITVGPR